MLVKQRLTIAYDDDEYYDLKMECVWMMGEGDGRCMAGGV